MTDNNQNSKHDDMVVDLDHDQAESDDAYNNRVRVRSEILHAQRRNVVNQSSAHSNLNVSGCLWRCMRCLITGIVWETAIAD
jgi:hypothetical protein